MSSALSHLRFDVIDQPLIGEAGVVGFVAAVEGGFLITGGDRFQR